MGVMDDARKRVKAAILSAMEGADDIDSWDVAAKAMVDLRDIIEDVAIMALAVSIDQERRDRVWRIERAATRADGAKPTAPAWTPPTPEEQAAKDVRDAEYEARGAEIDRRFRESMQRTLDIYTNQMRMQWTNELLTASFALGDGTSVTWGDATVEQHRIRVEMLTQQASGTLETAARHQSAINDLEAEGQACLNDLTVQ